MKRLRIVIFSDSTGWHERQLAGACTARQAEASVVSLRECRIVPGGGIDGLLIPGFERRLPDAAFVRCVPGGSFEQVTLRLDVLHALGASGTPVFNGARAIECTVDKAMTSLLLSRAGIPAPPTWVCESAAVADQIHRREAAAGHKLVLKPLFGNRGRGLLLLDADSVLPDAQTNAGVYYLQRFVPSPARLARDWRLMVIGKRTLTAMERVSRHWITNRARGAACRPARPTDAMCELAERATAAVAADYAGVDITQDENGDFLVLEVNSIPAWSGLQQVSTMNIADALIGALCQQVPGGMLNVVQ